MKNQKATKNPINKYYDKCFQYAAKVALKHKEIGKKSERISKTNTSFIVNIIGKE